MDDDDYAYKECDSSFADNDAGEELLEMMEWAENEGCRHLIDSREGANFVRYGNLWLIPLFGGQPIHHDRHISETEGGSHDTWNIVCSGEGDQMLVTEVAQDIFNHMPLTTGSVIYLNTTNRHLVTRNDGNEVSILLQIAGHGANGRDQALSEMLHEWKKYRHCHDS